jgi:hypothetical protein
MSGVQLLKYALYGLLGFELSLATGNGWLVAGIVVTVLVIEQLGIIQSRRF